MNESKTPLHFKRITIGGLTGLKNIEIIPTGDVTVIGGENEAGKTRILNAIEYIFSGKPPLLCPLGPNDKEAFVNVDLGPVDSDEVLLECQRRWFYNSKGEIDSELIVWPGRGNSLKRPAPYKGPQGVVEALLAKFTLDPMEFINKKPSDRVKAVRDLVGYDESDIRERHNKANNDISIAEANKTRLENRLADVKYDPKLPKEEQSAQKILDDLAAANLKNGAIDDLQRATDNLKEENSKRGVEIERLKTELASLESLHKTAAEIIEENETKLLAEIRIDTAELGNQLASVNETNAKIRANNERAKAEAEFDEWEEKRVEAERVRVACLAEYKTRLQSLVSEKGLGIEGVEIKDEELWIKDIPFGQINTAQAISLWFKIATASNPQLRAFRIDHGESILSKTMESIVEVAKEYKCQVIIAKAMEEQDLNDPNRAPTVFIKDGAIFGGESTSDAEPADEQPGMF